MTKDYYKEPVKVVRLWVHECERVLADRMINDTDMTKFNEFRVNVTKKHFDDVNQVLLGSPSAKLLLWQASCSRVAAQHEKLPAPCLQISSALCIFDMPCISCGHALGLSNTRCHDTGTAATQASCLLSCGILLMQCMLCTFGEAHSACCCRLRWRPGLCCTTTS